MILARGLSSLPAASPPPSVPPIAGPPANAPPTDPPQPTLRSDAPPLLSLSAPNDPNRSSNGQAAAPGAAKPRGPIVDSSIATQQRDALAVLEASLPHLVERERFRFDAEYFTV